MKAEQLKNSILQMAVQGKLVPQDPKDEPASVLLERIREEKQRLVEEGKIKKAKTNSVIFRVPLEEDCSSDNLPYAVLDYDLPAGWELCRLVDLYNFIDYRGATPTKISSGIPFVTAKNVKVGYTDYSISEYISQDSYDKRKRRGISCKGDILFTTEAPLGNVALADLSEFSAGQRLITLQNYSAETQLNNVLFMNFLLSDFFRQQLKEKQTGTTVKGIKAEKLKELMLPVPPFAEQQRIVERIEKLLPHIAAYDTAEQKLSKLNAAFPDALKKSILQAAVQSKLVEQNPNDEPALVLLERMRAEKEALVKAGKIKRDKHESAIFRRDNSYYEKLDGIERCIDDEIPFEIPDSWMWTRLGEICNYGDCISISSEAISPDSWMLNLEDIERESGRLLHRKIKNEVKSLSTKHCFFEGQVLYSKLRPYLNKVIIADRDGYCTSEILPLNFGLNIFNRYAHLFLMSPYFVDYATQCSYGVKMPRLGTNDGKNALVPLPPFDEQVRIVIRLDALLSMCNRPQ